MRERYGYLKIIAAIVALVIMVVGVMGLTAIKSQTGRKALASAIEEAAGRYFAEGGGHDAVPKLEIGKISGPGMSGLVLDEVALVSGKSRRRLIYASKVKVKYNILKAAIYRGRPEAALTGIEIYGPRLILAKDGTGQWELLSLLAPGPKGGSGLFDKANFAVSVRGGEARLAGIEGLENDSMSFGMGLRFTGGRLDIGSFDGSIGAGRLKAGGYADLNRSRLDITVEETGIKVADIAAISGKSLNYRVKGDTSGAIRIAGGFARPSLDYDIKVTGASISSRRRDIPDGREGWSVPVEDLKVKGSYGSGIFHVSKAEAKTGGTVAAGRGTLSMTGSLDFVWSARSADPAKDMPSLARLTGWKKGQADIGGVVRGTVEAPVMSASVTARDVSLLGISADMVRGDVSFSEGRLEIDKGQALLSGEHMAIDGILGISDPGITSLRLSAAKAPAAVFFKALGLEPMGDGNADMTAEVTGGADGYKVAGSINSARYSAFGFDASDISVGFEYNREGLRLNKGRLSIGDGSAALEGLVDPLGNLRLNVRSEGLQLASLRALIANGADMSGVASINADIGGNTGDPKVTGSIMADSLAYGRFDADTADGRFAYHRGELRFPAFSLSRGGAVYTGSGAISGLTGLKSGSDPAKAAIDGRIDVTGESIAELVDIAGGRQLSGLAQGVVDGTIDLGGTVGSPVAAIKASLPTVDLAGSRLSTGLELLYEQGKLKISRLTMPQLEQIG